MRDNRMSKVEMARALSKKLGVSQEKTQYMIDMYQEAILEGLEEFDSVKIGDFLILEKRERKQQVRILEGEEITTPPYIGLHPRVTGKYKKFER